MSITAKVYQTTLKIYINDLLHLSVPKSRFLSLQSWIESKDFYVIEIYLEGKTILCEYTSREKWVDVLKLLDQHLP